MLHPMRSQNRVLQLFSVAVSVHNFGWFNHLDTLSTGHVVEVIVCSRYVPAAESGPTPNFVVCLQIANRALRAGVQAMIQQPSASLLRINNDVTQCPVYCSDTI